MVWLNGSSGGSIKVCCLLLCVAAWLVCSTLLAEQRLPFVFDTFGLRPIAPVLLEEWLGCSPVTSQMVKRMFWPLQAHRAALIRSSDITMARRRSHQLQELARIQVLNGSLHCGAEAACKHPKVQDVLRAMLLLLSVSRVGDADFLFDFSDNVCYRELGQRRVARRRRGLRLRSPIPVVTHDVDVDRRPRCENILAPPRSLSALPDGARWLSRIDSAPTDWEQRRNQVLWRGAATGPQGVALFNITTGQPCNPRAVAVALSKRRPDLLDARFAGRGSLQMSPADRKMVSKLGFGGGPAEHLTWEEQQKRYRAVLVIDGNTVADRFPFTLFTMTAVLKQESPLREAWYDLLVPYVHYIPVRHDLTDLEEKMEWALANATRLYEIAHNAAALAMRYLSRNGQICHWSALLRMLNSYTSQVEIDPSAAQVDVGGILAGRVTHMPISSALRPQLAHIPPRPEDLRSLLSLHPTPCIGTLTQRHTCVDL